MATSLVFLIIYLFIVFQTHPHRVLIIYLVIVADILYSTAHWMFSWQYFSSALDIESVISYKKPVKRKLRSYINIGFIVFIVAAYLVSLVMELIKEHNGTYVFGESSTFLFAFFGLVTTILLCYAVLRIRGIIARFPHLKHSNKMMSAHLIMFTLNEVTTIVQIVIPYVLYKNATTTQQLTTADNVNSTLLFLGLFTVFPLTIFIAYLLILFSNPVDDLSSDGKTPTFLSTLRGGAQFTKIVPQVVGGNVSMATDPISSTNSAMSGYVTVSLDELEFNVRVFAGFVINKTEPSTGSFYGDGNPMLDEDDQNFQSLYSSDLKQPSSYENNREDPATSF